MNKTRRRIVRWLIALLVLALVLVVGDRVAAYVAERQIAKQVASSAASEGAASEQRPHVDIHGFPFLTQVVGGEYGQVDIALRDVHANGLVFPRLVLEAYDIDAPLTDTVRGGSIVAARVEATGTVSAESLSNLVDDVVDFDISVSTSGDMTIDATLNVFGNDIPLQGTGSVSMADNAIVISAGDFNAVGTPLPPGGEEIVRGMVDRLNTTVALPTLPYGITLTDLEFTSDAIHLKGYAEDVTLT
ncbi:LmeA family phospholipid-binding protein [Natronoglycomyces albus]|uniref:DUF2993 domain-containing protein n=1 Tax=Natronoglycomyces albus TaxID=2811108 RepID=A0A895XNI2_9ACTN|nr:DUF2993 domain-containing protein [Natronoglycomyces albus]QSB05103.1 DUF2993 domain-containing protein [Natronoglycomyces albus]